MNGSSMMVYMVTMLLIVRPIWPICWIDWSMLMFLWRRPCMPTANSYDYAIIRVVPRVERGECLNAGIILFCRASRFLAMRMALDEQRLLALAPSIDLVGV